MKKIRLLNPVQDIDREQFKKIVQACRIWTHSELYDSYKKGGSGVLDPLAQGFGYSAFANGSAYNGGPHTGIDLGLDPGVELRAAHRGVISKIRKEHRTGIDYGYGTYIRIWDKEQQIVSFYGHMMVDSVDHLEEDLEKTIEAGTYIGKCVNTGYSTGFHLHFEIRHVKAGTLEYEALDVNPGN